MLALIFLTLVYIFQTCPFAAAHTTTATGKQTAMGSSFKTLVRKKVVHTHSLYLNFTRNPNVISYLVLVFYTIIAIHSSILAIVDSDNSRFVAPKYISRCQASEHHMAPRSYTSP